MEHSWRTWKSNAAKTLLDAYEKAKARLLSGGDPLQTPEEWAGSLMVLYGSEASVKLDALPMPSLFRDFFPRSKIKELLDDALNQELAIEHGEVTCGCGRTGVPTIDWLCRSDGAKTLWKCASCARSLS